MLTSPSPDLDVKVTEYNTRGLYVGSSGEEAVGSLAVEKGEEHLPRAFVIFTGDGTQNSINDLSPKRGYPIPPCSSSTPIPPLYVILT